MGVGLLGLNFINHVILLWLNTCMVAASEEVLL